MFEFYKEIVKGNEEFLVYEKRKKNCIGGKRMTAFILTMVGIYIYNTNGLKLNRKGAS